MNIPSPFMGGAKISFASEGTTASADDGLIGEIKDAIENNIIAKGSNIDVKDSDCPEGFNGNNPKNIVNS